MRFWLGFLLALCVISVIFYAVWEYNLSIGEYVRRPTMGFLYGVVAMGFLWATVYTYLRRLGAHWDWRYLLVSRLAMFSVFCIMWNSLISPIGEGIASAIFLELLFTASLFMGFVATPKKREIHPVES